MAFEKSAGVYPELYSMLAKRHEVVCKSNGWHWWGSSGRWNVIKVRI